MSEHLVIAGVDVHEPQSLTIGYQDVDYNSGRAADGTMYRNRVANKVKLQISWPPMTPDEAKTVMNAASAETFQVTYYDLRNGSAPSYLVTGTFYCGDQSAPIYSFNHDGAGSTLVSNVSFDLIEV